MPKKVLVLRPVDIFLIIVIFCLAAGLLILGSLPRERAPQPEYGYVVTMAVPAVDSHGNGIATSLSVETKKGSGKTLANIDVLLFWVDTQQSIQTARSVAEELTGIDTSTVDLIYSVDAKNATLIGGPSAGAALTIATIGALEGRQPTKNIMITGTIEENYSIGAVGGVLEKAKAAKKAGADLFLVPQGESTETFVQPSENCSMQSGFVYCEKTYSKKTVDISQEVGLPVVEINDISDALSYFFK